eukprot:scaffold14658_cov67-Phaeocystis_antarctica.AAC.11
MIPQCDACAVLQVLLTCPELMTLCSAATVSSSAISTSAASSVNSTRSTCSIRSSPGLAPGTKQVGATSAGRLRFTPAFSARHCRPASAHQRFGGDFCSATTRAALCAPTSA